MARSRDSQRARVYRAERVIHSTEAEPRYTMTKTRAYVRRVEKSALWAEMRRYRAAVDIGDGRGRSNAAAFAGLNYITLPIWSRQPAVILHELAHLTVSTTAAGHGPEFAQAHLKLVSRFMGAPAAKRLRDSYRANGVKVARGATATPARKAAAARTF